MLATVADLMLRLSNRAEPKLVTPSATKPFGDEYLSTSTLITVLLSTLQETVLF